MNKKRIIAGVLAASVMIGNMAMTGTSVYASTPSNGQKEEVVYIMTDANGKADTVDVVNIFGKGDITDYGNYSSVKMLTAADTITQNGDTITFSTNKDKVYYQGTMNDAQIPWNISITYILDGKVRSAEELAGQSGALKIQIQITENTKCSNDFFNNYALQAALTLDTKRCKNITADGATLANAGADKQISYTILPGKGLDAVITAEVADFKMDAIAINGIKLNLNIEIDDAELMGKVTEIMDASAKLNDGAATLSDGTAKLNDAGGNLSSGADLLYDATSTLNSGISSLSQGVRTMQEGLDTLNAKSSTLTSGSTQIKEALATMQSSLADVSVSTEQLKQLTDSSSAISQGISDLYDGAVTLQTNLSYEAYRGAMNQNGLNIDDLKYGNSAAITTLSEQMAGLQALLNDIQTAYPQYAEDETLAAQAAQLEAQITSLSEIAGLLNGNSAAIGGTETYLNTVSSGVDSLVSGLLDLKDKYETYDAAIVALANTLSGLAVNMSSLKNGIEQLVTNYAAFDSGITEYTNGTAAIAAGYSELVDGVSTLAAGSKELLEGTGTLKQGTSDLYDGMISLGDGAADLNDGTSEFYEKTSDMDTQVEESIEEMIASISGDETETVSFVSDKNKNVKSVQFVIKTSAIEKEEAVIAEDTTTTKLNFWQKLLHLFGK